MLKIPDAIDSTVGYSGHILVQNWSGEVIKVYKYDRGIRQVVSVSFSSKREAITETKFPCAHIDYYRCVTVGNDPTKCKYDYTETIYCDQPRPDPGDPGCSYPCVGEDPSTGGGPIPYNENEPHMADIKIVTKDATDINTVGRILYHTFGTNDNINIAFYQRINKNYKSNGSAIRCP